MKKTVLVTGATGFLGSHLVKGFLQKKYQVIILKRSFSNTWRIDKFLHQLISFDIDLCEIEQPFQEFKKIDAVIHTATCYGRHNESVIDIFEANTFLPLRLLENAYYFGIKTFINTDTFYNKGIIPYQALPNYSLSKYQFTEWGKQLASMRKIIFLNIRLEQVFGWKDDDSKFAISTIKHLLQNMESIDFTPGEQTRDFIYVDDVVSAYLFLLDKLPEINQGYTEYELGCGQSISLRHFVETVHELANSKTELNFGILPYRDSEIMHSQANINPLNKLGWFPRWKLNDALVDIIEKMK